MKNLKRKKSFENYQLKYSEVECPICMDEMSLDRRSVTIPCMHEFCLGCIGKWLMESSSQLCPLCKQPVKKIMYDLEPQLRSQSYSLIGFPADFCAGWTIRNKMKSVFDDFDNVLRKLYVSIKNLLETNKEYFDSQILSYLVLFGNVKIRVKSRLTADEIQLTSLLSEYFDLSFIKDLLTERLNMLFKLSITTKIIKEIYKNESTFGTIEDILLLLKENIDPERMVIVKKELECQLLLSYQRSTLYKEYYIPLRYCCGDIILYTDNKLIDHKTLAALITRMLCSFNLNFDEDKMLLAHVNRIHELCSFDYVTSFEKLIHYMSETSHFILRSNSFYKNSKLKNKKQIQSRLISNNAYNLVKHCFSEDQFSNLSLALELFDKEYINTGPYIVEDSSSEEESEQDCDDNVVLTGVYVEISDSDDDALQVLSIQQPTYDLSDDSSIHINDSPPPVQKRCRKNSENSVHEVSESSTIAMDELSGENMQPSTSNHEIFQVNNVKEEEHEDVHEVDDTESLLSDCVITEENRLNVDFIYEPRSTEDFYQYLLSEQNPS